ncbi:MAG: patatin-like phospholipase family protein [Clostridium sp.]|nr:patatin-like phospholipase family protein [Prevotella sp.]MCM1429456.1 patatin-like phospholipase family protein [Clostridium sp.]
MIRIFFCILFSLCLYPVGSFASCRTETGGAAGEISDSIKREPDPFSRRPRVGLVLSGGGAKGIAHIGVIQALEENDITIDCVAGTSMGAIVGSLYSCGWSPGEMLKFVKSKDFSYWSTGTINPDHIYYYNQPEPSPEWLGINIALKDTTSSLNGIFPSNLISPLPMNIEFLRLYAPYSQQCDEDFNRLFVPLRTVCSDVYHKHKIVCSEGPLGDAIRASMSFPMVFKPIEMNGVLVYDGGIYDNFPVDVMQEDFNPEFIIGVSVSGPDEKPQPGNIYSQVEDMIIQNNNYDVPSDIGVKIQVPVLNYGVLDFGDAQEIYDIGYKTGLAMVDSIKQRTPARTPLSEVTARRQAFAAKTPEVIFDSIAIEGGTRWQDYYLRKLFYESKSPHPINMEQTEKAYYRAVTGRKLTDLLPQYIMGKDGDNTLLLKATMKKPWSIGIGGWITSSTQSMLYLTMGYHTLSFNSLDADLRLWIGQSYWASQLSGRWALTGDIPSMVEATLVFNRQKYYNTELLFYQDSTPTFVTDQQGFLRLSYRRAMGLKGLFSASFSAGLVTDRYFPTNETDYVGKKKDKSNYRIMNVAFDYQYSTLDSRLFPMSGSYFDINVIGYRENVKYKPQGKDEGTKNSGTVWGMSLEATWRHFHDLHPHFKLGTSAFGLVTVQGLFQNYTATLVHAPAFAPTPSTENYFNTAFRSDNYLAAGLSPIWNPVGKLQLRGEFYAYMPIRNLSQRRDGSCYYNGWFRRAEFLGEIAAVYNLPFASLSIYCNYLSYPAGNWNFGINLGFPFHAPRIGR